MSKIFKRIGLIVLYVTFFTLAIGRFSGLLTLNIVDGQSMNPTYMPYDYVIGTNINEVYNRGDVVIVKSPSDKMVIKRIIGLPGETIRFEKGSLFIDEVHYQEPYVMATHNQQDFSMGEIILQEDEYFIVGDNRDVSLDSRTYGPVKLKDIKSEVKIKIPFSKFIK